MKRKPQVRPKRRRAQSLQKPETDAERLYRTRDQRFHDVRLRPAFRDDVIGQNEALSLVETLLCAKPPAHVLLLGPPGCGKTTVARLALDLAKATGRSAFAADAPFVVVDGANTRHDQRNGISPFTTVAVEGFYANTQETNGKLDLHPDTPRIYLGAMARAHLGALFIDEVGELARESQISLLTVLEEGLERIEVRASSDWVNDPRTPPWMRCFVEVGVPASFVLIGATTRNPNELDAALRSRCEIVRMKALDFDARREVARRTAGRLGVGITEDAATQIASTSGSARETTRRVVLAAASAVRRSADVIEATDLVGADVAERVGFRG